MKYKFHIAYLFHLLYVRKHISLKEGKGHFAVATRYLVGINGERFKEKFLRDNASKMNSPLYKDDFRTIVNEVIALFDLLEAKYPR